MSENGVMIIDQAPAAVLSEPLQRIALRALAADRKGGEALLEKAAAIADARALAAHGDWHIFLAAIGVNERAARRLLDIHQRAMESLSFADGVQRGWLNFSVAALAANADDVLLETLLVQAAPPSARVAQALANAATLPHLPHAPPPTNGHRVTAAPPIWRDDADDEPAALDAAPPTDDPPHPLVWAPPAALNAADDTSDDWYTPPALLALARQVLGGIDLDPASCATAQAVVQAARYYTLAEDGLAQPWAGRVWLNCPFSAPAPWIGTVLLHYHAGAVPAALILTNSDTDTHWWQELATPGLVLFFRGRVNFWHPTKSSGRNRTGQTLVYLGEDRAAFRATFGDMGVIR